MSNDPSSATRGVPVDKRPPLSKPAVWACPVCGHVDPDQHDRIQGRGNGICPFSYRGGGPNREFRHPYGDDREPTEYVLVPIQRADG